MAEGSVFTVVCHTFCLGGGGVWSEGGVSHFSEGGLPFFRRGLPFFRGVSHFSQGSPHFLEEDFSEGVFPFFAGALPFFRVSPIFQRQGLPFSEGVSHFTEGVFHFSENTRPPPIREYGQCAVGTHPTGMHTCYLCMYNFVQMIGLVLLFLHPSVTSSLQYIYFLNFG